jgi:hypothetical protein
MAKRIYPIGECLICHEIRQLDGKTTCNRCKVRSWRKSHPKADSIYVRTHREKHEEANKKWRKENRERHLEIRRAQTKRYILDGRSKVRSWTKKNMKKCGVCFDCKQKKKTEFHHKEYMESPKVVLELCKDCHLKRHYGTLEDVLKR